MSTIEIMALIASLVVPVKIAMLLKGQKFWFETVTRRYWGNALVTSIASLIVIIVTLYFLLKELTIVHIWAVVLFAMALISLALAPFSKFMLEVERKWFAETNVLKTGWIALLVWMGFAIWVLIEIFF